MERLKLVALGSERSGSSPIDRELIVGVGLQTPGTIGCCVLGEHMIEQGLFTSVHRCELSEDLWEIINATPRITRDNPFIDASELKKLDEQGLVTVGSEVQEGALLASILVARAYSANKLADRLPRGMQWVTDRSLRVPIGWGESKVASVRYHTREQLRTKGLLGKVEVTLEAHRPLVIGDVLLIAEEPLVVSQVLERSRMPQDGEGQRADIVVSPEMATRLGITPEQFAKLAVSKVDDRAEDALRARNTGAYSLISLAPLARYGKPGQPVTVAQVEFLRKFGLHGLLRELSTVNCGGLPYRQPLKNLAESEPGSVLDSNAIENTPDAAPESLLQLSRWLITLGLQVEMQAAGDPLPHVQMTLRPATADDIRTASRGVIRKPETLNYRTLEAMDDGLFAPNVFGPEDTARRYHYGHMELAARVVPYVWRIGRPSVLAQVLEIPDEQLEQIVLRQADVVWDEPHGTYEIVERKETVSPNDERSLSGAAAIDALLTQKSPDALPPHFRDAAQWLTTDVVVVAPPDLRPIVQLDNGNFATSDLNDLYRLAINRNNRLSKLIDLSAPQTIIDNEQRELQQAVDALHANMLVSDEDATWGESQRRLKCVLSMIEGSVNIRQKTVDFSGQARLLPDNSVPPSTVLVPLEIFDTLRMAEDVPVLLTRPDGEGAFLALLPKAHDEYVLRVSQGNFSLLAEADANQVIVRVHRPTTQEALADAKRLMGQNLQPQADESSTCWLDAESLDELLEQLVQAAVSHEPRSLSSARGLLIGGTGSTGIVEDAELRTSHVEQRKQVPIPPDEPTARSQPTMRQYVELAESRKRKACVFDVQEADQSPPAAAGRLGGDPYLPPGFEWPLLHGKPLALLGQFPLDLARKAGALPIEVEPNSMLTIFLGEEAWEPGPCGVRNPVFIHSTEDLVLHPSPDEAPRVVEPCAIRPRIVEEVPAWTDMQELIEWELRHPERKLTSHFHNELWPRQPEAHTAIKLGGWPAWIQSPETQCQLLLQITSDDDAELMFGDAGTLYIFVEENGLFTCLMQCY